MTDLIPWCTWKDCERPGPHVQRDSNDKPWAYLCDEHHAELDSALMDLDAKRLIRCWILAKGGAAQAARS